MVSSEGVYKQVKQVGALRREASILELSKKECFSSLEAEKQLSIFRIAFFSRTNLGVPMDSKMRARECKSIIVNPKDLRYRVLLIHKDKSDLKGTNVLRYIEWGEEQGFHKRPTCVARQKWYELPIQERRESILCRRFFNEIHNWPLNAVKAYADQTFYIAYTKDNISKLVAACLNSTLGSLFTEICGRFNLGLGALQYAVYESALLPLIDPKNISNSSKAKLEQAIDRLSKLSINTVFEEIGANSPEEVSFDKVNSDRRALDRIIIQEVLGLSEEEQLEVYRAVIDLVKTRIERAKTVTKRKKKGGIDVEALANGIITRLPTEIGKFPDAYLGDYKGLWSKEIKIPVGQPIIGSDISGFYVQVKGEEVYRGWSHDEAKFIYFAALTGASHVKLPLDRQTIKAALKAFEEDYNKLKEEVNELLLTLIPDAKIRKKVEDKLWNILFPRQSV